MPESDGRFQPWADFPSRALSLGKVDKTKASSAINSIIEECGHNYIYSNKHSAYVSAAIDASLSFASKWR